MEYIVLEGDSLEVLRGVASDSVDSVVTDPPYGIKFMGKKWDYAVPSVDIWRECFRVLKPGGHLLSFASTRTHHRMAVNIEDAGFEIRDMIAWVYGSGFPKSLDVSKAIDKAAGAEREVVREVKAGRSGSVDETQSGGRNYRHGEDRSITAPATEAARQWQGWGTALKPALEPITVARKPFKGTVASNVLRHGTGALNIDGCRVAADDGYVDNRVTQGGDHFSVGSERRTRGTVFEPSSAGRWPANLIHDGSEEPTGLLGDAARFFYCPKASKRDRDEGLNPQAGGRVNDHPTVKPTALMRYLVRLVTPPSGRVLDPFCGSGTTGKACALEGFGFLGIDDDPKCVDISRRRIKHALDSLIWA